MLKSIVSVFAITASMMTITANEVLAAQIGVLGLYEVNGQSTAKVNSQKILELGCSLRLDGVVGNEDGDIGIDKPNRFIFLACDDTILAIPAKRHILDTLMLEGKSLAILEGDLTNMPIPQGADAISARQYILKVSHYNNQDTDGRERDLNALGEAVQSLPDTYVAEALIGVRRATGMQTPDEAVILFYHTPEQGGRFRKNNDDILEKIVNFNNDHLDDYIYYVGNIVQ